MRYTRIAMIFILVATLTPVAARAGRYELTPYASYRWDGRLKDTNSEAEVALFDLEFKASGAAGVWFDVETTAPYLQLELLWDHQFSSLEARNNTTGERLMLGDVAVDMFHLGVLYEVSQVYSYTDEPPLRPFLGFTVGASRFEAKESSISAQWRFSVAFMMGIKWYFAERIGLRMQGRLMTAYFNGNDETFCDDAGQCLTVVDAAFMNQFDLSAGLILSF